MKKIYIFPVLVIALSVLLCACSSEIRNANPESIGINGIMLGDTAKEKWLGNMIMDSHYLYEYKDVEFNIDSKVAKRITEVAFFTATTVNGIDVGIDDVVINYYGESIRGLNQIVETFGDFNSDGEILYTTKDNHTVKITKHNEYVNVYME